MKTTAKLIHGLILGCFFFLGGCNHFLNPQQQAVEHYVTAVSYHGAEQDSHAIAELQAAVALDREFSLAFSLMGDLYRQNDQLDQAAEAYENACQLDPWFFDDHFHLGQVYQTLERFDDAIRPLLRACFLQTDHTEAHYALGICYYETELYESAVEYCEKAAQLDPDNHLILTSLGDIYSQTGDPNQAITAFKQSLEIDDQQVDVMIRLGTTYLDLQQFAPARLILEKAAQTAPAQPEPYLALAYCLLVEGNYQLNLKNEQPDPQNSTQARLHLQQAEHLYRQAQQQYENARQIDPDNHLAYNGLGVACMMLSLNSNQPENFTTLALQHWQHSVDLFPDQPKIKNLMEKYTK